VKVFVFSVFFLVGLQVLAKRELVVDEALISRGASLYKANCVACHGANADGRGPAAVAINGAKPRDFTKGDFKFGSSPQEIFNTITKGSAGTAMPPWVDLPEKDRWALTHYIKSISKK